MEKDQQLVTLESFGILSDAQMLKGMLEGNGIPAMVTEEYNPLGTVFSMSRVLVFAHDLDEARRLMAAGGMSEAQLDAMAEDDKQ